MASQARGKRGADDSAGSEVGADGDRYLTQLCSLRGRYMVKSTTQTMPADKAIVVMEMICTQSNRAMGRP